MNNDNKPAAKNTVLRGYKYRLYPTIEQQKQLAQHFGCRRFVYNHFLDLRKTFYETSQEPLNYNAMSARLTILKQDKDRGWLKSVNAQVLQQSLMDLDSAYSNFFTRIKKGVKGKKVGFPKFKSKSNRQSFRVPQKFHLRDGMLVIPKITPIKIVLHRSIPENGVMKSVTVSKTPTNKYFASVLVEHTKPEAIQRTGVIGIDLGLKSYYADSNGKTVDSPKYLIKSQEKIRILSIRLSRKKSGSANRNKARIALAKGYEKVTNQRLDFLHKQSINLIRENQTIGIEDLAVKNMLTNHRLAKHISDASWSTFVRLLEYKVELHSGEIYKVGRYFPSTQLCSHCGYRNAGLTLKDREWICPECGTQHERDINSAVNIRDETIKQIAARELNQTANNNTVGHTGIDVKASDGFNANVYGDNVRLPLVATVVEVETFFREEEAIGLNW